MADNGMLYLYGPTGLVMEFDRLGYNSRTLLCDPQGSFVSSSDGAYTPPGSNGILEGTRGFPVFYDAYGLPAWTPPAPVNYCLNQATSQPFKYKGQYGYYTDGASGLVYCQHRYYDPNTGRWTERDPTGLDGGVNVYQYADGNPVLGLDPTGLDGLFVYGEDKKSGDKTWRDLANKYAALYEYLNPGRKAHVVGVGNLSDLKKAFATTKNIDACIYDGHAGVDSRYTGTPLAHLYVSSTAEISSYDIGSLDTFNVKPGAFFFLMGCGTAAFVNQPRVGQFDPVSMAPGTPSLAQAFSRRFKTDVYGFLPHVTPGPVPHLGSKGFNFKNFLGTQYFHNGWDTVMPVVYHH